MPPLDPQTEAAADRHWRSLAELDSAPRFRAFMEAEFPAGTDPKGINRRRWLQLMGASLALAGVSGCRWPQEEILPFAARPDGRIPGQPERYATAMDLAGNAVGLMVTTVDGRPIKVEGNPAHPMSLGATHLFAQAAILELYDPDRSGQLVKRSPGGGPAPTWDKFGEFAESHFGDLRSAEGAGLCVLADANSSPTRAGLRDQLLEAFPQAKWVEYEPLSSDNELAGAKIAFGQALRTHAALDRAEVIACLDADPLGTHPAALKYARQFAAGRNPATGQMNRLYAVESGVSITGGVADHRLAVRSGQVAGIVAALREEIQHVAAEGEAGAGSSHAGHDHGEGDSLGQFVHALAADLVAHRGSSVVLVGPAQPPEVHAEVHRLNVELQNVGQTVTFSEAPNPDRPSHVEAIQGLTQDMLGGQVNTLVMLGGNPVYDAPADIEFGQALEKVPTSIHLGLYRNETARACTWHLPQSHFLEAWGDARAYDGIYSVVQPMIEPLHGGRSAIELLAMLLGSSSSDAQTLVRNTFQTLAGGAATPELWRRTVHDGLLNDSAYPAQEVSLVPGERLAAKTAPDASDNADYEIVFAPDASLFDGRFANSGWLQECPRPLSKLTWDNAAIMAPATAKQLGVEFESVVTLKYRDRQLTLPVFVMPGQAAGSITVWLGYGRTAAGRVGGEAPSVPTVGVDTYKLRTAAAMHFDSGLTVERTGQTYDLATTQDHHAIDQVGMEGRASRLGKLVREGTLEHYREHPDFVKHMDHGPPLESLWKEHKYEGHQWGMSIDLSKCIGCNACVVACQAENNIPVVGKEQVLVGREMHWIRVDRYFRGDENDPGFAHQPVACQHCELAPCEQVCPVNATVHSSEGLNDMVYNRCIGTRYCGNNCPFKVRRFNYFNYHKDLKDANNQISKMMFNPEVTVRARGVMEKCTFCVQRIQAVKIEADNAGREVADGEIKTACQQVCPTQAIAFGDLADANSEVRRQQQLDLAYAMLGELNIKPRTTYLARIRNPQDELGSSHNEHDGDTH